MSDRVVFLRPDAERIARAVRRVEGMRQTPPLTFRRVTEAPRQKEVFKVCTFTGAWSINASKTVTFRGVTATPNTVAAVNLFAAIGTAAGSPRNCAIAKDGTAWYVIAAECR